MHRPRGAGAGGKAGSGRPPVPVLWACCASCWCSPSSQGSARPRARPSRAVTRSRSSAGGGSRPGETVVIDPSRLEVRTGGPHGRGLVGGRRRWPVPRAQLRRAARLGRARMARHGGRASPWTGPTACCSTGRAPPWRGSCPPRPGRSPVPPIPPVRRRTLSAGRASPTAPLPSGLTPVGRPDRALGPDRGRPVLPCLRRHRRGRHLDRLRRLHRHRRIVARRAPMGRSSPPHGRS